MILAACGVLVLLWASSIEAAAGTKLPRFWQTVVDRGAAPQVVTICAAAIRTSMVLQLSLVTAALAAVVMETSGTTLASAAGLSIKRASGSGPLEILTLSGFGLLRRPRGSMVALLSTVAVLVLVLSTILSTVLLSDFTDTTITGSPKEMNLAVRVEYPRFRFATGAKWSNIPASPWRFAESDEGANTTRDDPRDTGDTFVAMLPFPDADSRTRLVHYEGPASVSNTRTFCFAPAEDDTTSITIVRKADMYAPSTINGTFIIRPVTEMLRLFFEDAQEQEVYFECDIFSSFDEDKNGGWPVTICMAWAEWVVGRRDGMDMPYLMMPSIVIDARNWGTTDGQLYNPTQDMVYPVKARKDSETSVWATISSERLDLDVLSLSVCVLLMGAVTNNVTIHGHATETEPEAVWDQGSGTGDPGWNTEALSRQSAGLSADGTSLTIEQRGLLHLSPQQSDWRHYLDSADFVSFQSWNPWDPDNFGTPEGNMRERAGFFLPNSTQSAIGHEWSPHRIYSSEFQDVLQRTGSLPLAVRSFLTRLWQTHYASYVRSGGATYDVTAVFAVTALLPGRWAGLAVVLGFVLAHFVLLILTAVLFLGTNGASRLWHPWQAVAQVVTPETEGLLRAADTKSDRETRKWADKSEGGTASYRVAYATSAERHQLELMSSEYRRREYGSLEGNES